MVRSCISALGCRNKADLTSLISPIKMPRKTRPYQSYSRDKKTRVSLFSDARQNAYCDRVGATCIVRESSSTPPRPTRPRRQAGSHWRKPRHKGLPDAPAEPCVKTLVQRQCYHPHAPSLGFMVTFVSWGYRRRFALIPCTFGYV